MKLRSCWMHTLASIAIGLVWLPQANAETDGRELADRLCARCHAIRANDRSKLPLAPPFRDIANRYSVWGLQEALAEGIVVGHPQMPEFVLNPDEIYKLLTYMDSLRTKPVQK